MDHSVIFNVYVKKKMCLKYEDELYIVWLSANNELLLFIYNKNALA